jgi:replicative DNA helicase
MPADGFSAHFSPRGASDNGVSSSLQAEQSVLGAIMMNPACIEALPPGFGPHIFAGQDHAEIFEAAVAAARSGATYLVPMVEAVLPHLAEQDSYIRRLPAAAISYRPSDVFGYAKGLLTLYQRRAVLDLIEEVRRDVSVPDPEGGAMAAIAARASEALDRIAALQAEGKGATTLGDAVAEAIAAGEAAAQRDGGLAGVSSGFQCFDRRLGGLEGGAVYVLGARPAMGKTALAVQMAMRVAQAGLPVLFVSLEMQARQVGRRALALASRVKLEDLRSGDFTRCSFMAEDVVVGQRRLIELPLLIEDEPALTAQAIALRAKAAIRKFGKLGLLVIDHLHIMGRPESAARFGDTQAITEISGGVKRIAKELDIPVLLLAQLNRRVEGQDDKRPSMADLRQSGAVEQDAEAVGFLYRQEYYLARQKPEEIGDSKFAEATTKWQAQMEAARGRAEVIWDKVRDGETGVDDLRFDGERVRFFEEGEA